MSESKRFEDWNEVNCNDCQHYWTDACDGVPVGSEKRCTSFLATKRVDIPLQIKSLRKRVDGLNWAFIFVALAVIIHYLVSLYG